MRRSILSLLFLAATPLAAQELPPAPGSASPASSRIVVVFEVSAMPVTNRAPGDWHNTLPPALLERITTDGNFSGIDLGGPIGNGISVRFHFPDMEAYKLWSETPETVFMIGELQQIIGRGYSRTGVSMRRVPGDPFHAPVAPRGDDEPITPRRDGAPPQRRTGNDERMTTPASRR